MTDNFSRHGSMGVYRWGGGTRAACQACREKKRRCDRVYPCSNCKLRNTNCVYRDQDIPGSKRKHAAPMELESFVAKEPRLSGPGPTTARYVQGYKSVKLHDVQITSEEDVRNYLNSVTAKLPPVSEGRVLFKNFVSNVHCYFGVLHIPSTRALLEYTYEQMNRSQQPSLEDVLLLFVMFSGSLGYVTSELLEQLKMTKAAAGVARLEYERLATSLIDNTVKPLEQSTTGLAAISTLGNTQINQQGPVINTLTMRVKCLVMARMMGIDKLDSQKQRKHRDEHGYDAIELEVQRRIWWNMVASDWLAAFAGGSNEGAYMIQERHMKVDYPQNVNDDQITREGIEQRSLPCGYSDMSGFLERIRLATVCREVVDALPSPYLHEEEPPDYSLIVRQHDRLQNYLDTLPIYYRTDPTSTEQCRELCEKHPMVVLQRLSAHFSCQMRISRLHRPYHLEAFTDARYAKSREACVKAASTVLNLRGQMEKLGQRLGIYPARSWIFMQHIFVSALTLALEFSYNPDAPDAADRKAKVLAACQTLERAHEASGSIMTGVKMNIETLMTTLNERRNAHMARHNQPTVSNKCADGFWKDVMLDNQAHNGRLDQDVDQDWHVLFDQFLSAAPELDALQLDLLLDDLNNTSFTM